MTLGITIEEVRERGSLDGIRWEITCPNVECTGKTGAPMGPTYVWDVVSGAKPRPTCNRCSASLSFNFWPKRPPKEAGWRTAARRRRGSRSQRGISK